MNKLAILILNWNNKILTEACIKSIKLQKFKDYKIFVIDNNSSDDSVSFIKNKHKDIIIIRNKSNLGYGPGNNVGIIEALKYGYEYIFILNNDTELLDDTLGLLLNQLDKEPKIGVVAPLALSYFKNKKCAKKSLYYGEYNFLLGTFKNYILDDNNPIQVKIATGCALMFKSEVFRTCGLFNDKYFMYWEECDLLSRITEFGYTIFLQPQAIIYHRESSTSRFSNFPKNYFMLRNQLLFHKIYSTQFVFICFLVYFIAKLPIFLFRRKNIKYLKQHIIGIKHFAMNKYYKTNVFKDN